METVLNTAQTFDALKQIPRQAHETLFLSSVASDWNTGTIPQEIESALEHAQHNGAAVSILTSYYEPNKNKRTPESYLSEGISKETKWIGKRAHSLFERIQARLSPQCKVRFLIADNYSLITSADPTAWCEGNVETSITSDSPEINMMLNRIALSLEQTGSAPQEQLVNILEDESKIVYDGGAKENNLIHTYDEANFSILENEHDGILIWSEVFPAIFSPALIQAARRGSEVTILTNQNVGLLGMLAALPLFFNKMLGGYKLAFVEVPASSGIRIRGKGYVVYKDETPIIARIGSAPVGGIDYLRGNQNLAYYSANPTFVHSVDVYAQGLKDAIIEFIHDQESTAIDAYVSKRPHAQRDPLRLQDL